MEIHIFMPYLYHILHIDILGCYHGLSCVLLTCPSLQMTCHIVHKHDFSPLHKKIIFFNFFNNKKKTNKNVPLNEKNQNPSYSLKKKIEKNM